MNRNRKKAVAASVAASVVASVAASVVAAAVDSAATSELLFPHAARDRTRAIAMVNASVFFFIIILHSCACGAYGSVQIHRHLLNLSGALRHRTVPLYLKRKINQGFLQKEPHAQENTTRYYLTNGAEKLLLSVF